MIGASLLGAKESRTFIAPDRISLFTVPLRCGAAPEIGCGPISKPILLQLEGDPAMTQAWLTGTGTVLAVVWAGNDGQQTRTKAVQAVFEKSGLTATELDGKAREAELNSFLSADPWYRGEEVDNLSKQEAAIIGEVIHEAAMAMRFHAKINDFIELLHVYPTMAEALKIVAISRRKDPAKLACCAE